MASQPASAFWGMTINNYDATDLALVQQGYPDYIKQIVYTLEKGTEKETPHIQAYIRLYRDQRMTYVKKLFPRGSFKRLDSDEYRLNAQRYAQKLDATADSPAVITNNVMPDPVTELISVTRAVFQHFINTKFYDTPDEQFMWGARQEERARVREKPHLAKFYVSATYKNVKKEFWRSIIQHVVEEDKRAEVQEVEVPTTDHHHHHSDEKLSHVEGTDADNEGAGSDQASSSGGGSVCEGFEEGESSEDEGGSESGSSGSCSEDDSSGDGE